MFYDPTGPTFSGNIYFSNITDIDFSNSYEILMTEGPAKIFIPPLPASFVEKFEDQGFINK